MMWLLRVAALCTLALLAAAAPGPTKPVLGYSNWNGFHNKINTSLFIETAKFMKSSGLLDAGYEYVTLGGIGYAEGATWNDTQHGWGPAGPGNITRNATGFLQCDPVRFPGGNEGMRKLVDDVRAMGFKWGHYTESGTSGCNGAHGSSEGYEEQDSKLFFDDFKSEYLMVDSCGIEARPPPHGPPPDWPDCPANAPGCGPRDAQAQWEMTKWRELIDDAVAKGHPPIVLHDCHNGCGSSFGGPTLTVATCDATDPAQHWSLPLDGSIAPLADGKLGLCVGCGSSPVPDNHRGVGGTACGNDAASNANGTGLGMQACLGNAGQPLLPFPNGLGSTEQLWNFSSRTGQITQECHGNDVGCMASPPCLALVNGTGPMVISARDPELCGSPAARWTPKSLASVVHTDADPGSSMFMVGSAGRQKCLTSAGERVTPPVDPWCLANNNMWRSNTDVLQSWSRTMIEVESMANQGYISRPGAWSFPDCLELGVAGQGVYTWEESKSVLALFAVTSSPLILGNDPREGHMQQRLVELLTNPDMLAVDQQYSPTSGFAGGRIATQSNARELWAKPLPNQSVAVVLFNRAGTVIGEFPAKGVDPNYKPKHCDDPTKPPCTGCYINDDRMWIAPCDDNVTASSGAQTLSFSLDQIPREWLLSSSDLASSNGEGSSASGSLSCEAFDIFATAQRGKSLGVVHGTWSAVVPPHGVRFLRLSNCVAGSSDH